MFGSATPVLDALDAAAATGLLIPTHYALCTDDGSVVALTVGPFGRCFLCEVLTDWLTSDTADHVCRDCQGDHGWTAPRPVRVLYP